MADDSPPSTGIADVDVTAVPEVAAAPKPKRVRTGCLTCRERHLKCDEALPHCLNCKKSGKICKRGIKLNFHFIDVKNPDILPPTADWSVQFQDESRLIASEYKGGLSQYSAVTLDQTITPPHEPSLEPYMQNIDPNMGMQQHLPPIIQHNAPGIYPESRQHDYSQHSQLHSRDTSLQHSHTSSSAYLPTAPPALYEQPQRVLTPPNDSREYLTDPLEVLYMQVFVEEVGLWMDSMDALKHFSRILPFQTVSLPSPHSTMILQAFLACGARHLCLMDPVTYEEGKALWYYDTATAALMACLHDPDRDMGLCALTATILNVYEIMTERASQRMNHIAGARALVKECHWSARSTGVGAACFWLNVGMEVLSCLHFNWQTAWDPDQWGVDMDFDNQLYQEPGNGNEELWVHRILCLTAKICNFRATIPRFREKDPEMERQRTGRRVREWENRRDWCERWEQTCPRTMRPLGVLWPGQSIGPGARKSLFPEIWLLKRASITARLFYHTCMILLSTTHPLYPFLPPSSLPHRSGGSSTNYSHSSNPSASEELALLCLHHAHQTCGIVTHVKDRGVASVSLRSIAIAAEVLQQRGEQEEVMATLKRIRKDTGWNITFLEKELPEHWGWNSKPDPEPSLINNFFSQHGGVAGGQHGGGNGGMGGDTRSGGISGPGTPKALKGGMVNPMLAKADFSLPQHPYMQHYQPPNMRMDRMDPGMGNSMGGGMGGMGSMGGSNMGGGSGMANGGFGPQYF